MRFTGEGMEVLYSPYGLGPYVIGQVGLGWAPPASVYRSMHTETMSPWKSAAIVTSSSYSALRGPKVS